MYYEINILKRWIFLENLLVTQFCHKFILVLLILLCLINLEQKKTMEKYNQVNNSGTVQLSTVQYLGHPALVVTVHEPEEVAGQWLPRAGRDHLAASTVHSPESALLNIQLEWLKQVRGKMGDLTNRPCPSPGALQGTFMNCFTKFQHSDVKITH